MLAPRNPKSYNYAAMFFYARGNSDSVAPEANSKSPKKSASILLRVALALILPAATLLHAASPIEMVITNPGEDASTQMNIGWHADLGFTNCTVIYTRKSDTTWKRAATALGKYEHCDVFNGIASKTADNKDFNEEAVFLDYGATLSGLQPDTEYIYKVRAGEGVESVTHYFKTAGAKEFSFVWFGDSHVYSPLPARLNNAVQVCNKALAMDPSVDFLFSTGDVLAWGGSYSFWKTLCHQDLIKNYMFANVLGNHDNMTRTHGKNGAFFRSVNNFPQNGYAGQEGICYWFIYSKVLFITLNNEVMSKNPVEQAAAKKWAADVIQKMKGKYRYIFLCEHYEWFDGRSGRTSWYANWKDFCDEHKVALALSGNNHMYERTYPLCQDKVVPEGKGTIYMEVPSCDGERGAEAGTLKQNTEKLACIYSSHAPSGNGQVKTIGCVLVKVAGKKITTKLVYIDENGQTHVADEHVTRALPAQ